jgi:hypothetical protein
MSYIPETETTPIKLPGNYGGETLRKYCGLSNDRVSYTKYRHDAGPISTQRLYIAIMGHTKKKGGAA